MSYVLDFHSSGGEAVVLGDIAGGEIDNEEPQDSDKVYGVVVGDVYVTSHLAAAGGEQGDRKSALLQLLPELL